MASRLIRNQLPSNGLRVRAPCPPLFIYGMIVAFAAGFLTGLPQKAKGLQNRLRSVSANQKCFAIRRIMLNLYRKSHLSFLVSRKLRWLSCEVPR